MGIERHERSMARESPANTHAENMRSSSLTLRAGSHSAAAPHPEGTNNKTLPTACESPSLPCPPERDASHPRIYFQKLKLQPLRKKKFSDPSPRLAEHRINE